MRLVDHASDYAYEIVDSENPESSQPYILIDLDLSFPQNFEFLFYDHY